MEWNFVSDRSIYLQLIEQIEIAIVKGEYPPGSKLKAVRELASEARVNPNTMQKAMQELERMGLVYTQRTNGRFVSEDQELIQARREEIAQELSRNYMDQMREIGFSEDQIFLFLHSMHEKLQEDENDIDEKGEEV